MSTVTSSAAATSLAALASSSAAALALAVAAEDGIITYQNIVKNDLSIT